MHTVDWSVKIDENEERKFFGKHLNASWLSSGIKQKKKNKKKQQQKKKKKTEI